MTVGGQPCLTSIPSRRHHNSFLQQRLVKASRLSSHSPGCLVNLRGQPERQMIFCGQSCLSSTPSRPHHTCRRRRHHSTLQVTERPPRHPRRSVTGLLHRRPVKYFEKSDRWRGLPTSRMWRIIWASSCWSWQGDAACGSCRRGAPGRRPAPPP